MTLLGALAVSAWQAKSLKTLLREDGRMHIKSGASDSPVRVSGGSLNIISNVGDFQCDGNTPAKACKLFLVDIRKRILLERVMSGVSDKPTDVIEDVDWKTLRIRLFTFAEVSDAFSGTEVYGVKLYWDSTYLRSEALDAADSLQEVKGTFSLLPKLIHLNSGATNLRIIALDYDGDDTIDKRYICAKGKCEILIGNQL